MTVYLEAAEAVEREAARAVSLSAVAADLKRVGSLQLAANEALARLDDLTAQGERMSKEMEQAQHSAALDLASIKQQLAEALQQLDGVKADTAAAAQKAAADVDAVIAQARATAKQIVDAAATEAIAVQRATDAALADAKQQCADATAATAALHDEIIARKAEVDDLNNQISTIIANLGKGR